MISTFIKLDRNILRWRWYKDSNTFRLFVHLLLIANIKKGYLREVEIERGDAVTSYEGVANTLDMSKQEVRTAFKHLISTGEITVRRYSKFSVVSIVNYEMYQSNQHNNQQSTQQSLNTPLTDEQHHPKNIRNKEIYDYDVLPQETIIESSDTLPFYESMNTLPEDERNRLSETVEFLTKVYWSRSPTEYEKVSIYTVIDLFYRFYNEEFNINSDTVGLLTKAFEASANAGCHNVNYIAGVFRKYKERNIFTVQDYDEVQYQMWKERDAR